MQQSLEPLNALLATPTDTPIDPALVSQLCDRTPAFLLPVVLQLRHPHPDMTEDAVRRLVNLISLSIPDPSRTRILIDPEGTGRYDNFYPTVQVNNTPDTIDAIDTFLSNYGNIDPAEEELLNRMIFNPVPDYAATLERDMPTPAPAVDNQDRLLDAFIAADHSLHRPADEPKAADEPVNAPEPTDPTRVPKPAETPAVETPRAPAGSLLSESLAKIFIKQHNYQGAYEIISSLSLKYPEKSIYFADQLRFLRKLIINSEAQQQKNVTANKK